MSITLRRHIRRHLCENYCSQCGEYIYNPFTRRKIRHYHAKKFQKYNSLCIQRLRIYPKLYMVEWERRFPNVMRLMLTKEELMLGITKVRARRIQSCRIWTIDEWNTYNPSLTISYSYGMRRLPPNDICDILFVPDLTLF